MTDETTQPAAIVVAQGEAVLDGEAFFRVQGEGRWRCTACGALIVREDQGNEDKATKPLRKADLPS